MKPERLERSYPCLGNEFKLPGALFWTRMAAALVLLGLYFFAELKPVVSAAVLAVAALAAGYDILSGAVEDAMALNFRRERLPILLAVLLTLPIGRGKEGVIALLLLQIGYLAGEYALYMTRKSISAAVKGETDEIMERPTQNRCESLYERMRVGYAEMTDREQAVLRISGYLLPAALGLSLILLAVLPLAYEVPFAEAARRVATILAVASPLSLFLFLPLTYFSAMAAGRRTGALLLGARAVESVGQIKALVFDKAGTLTDEDFQVIGIRSEKLDAATFLKVAAHAADKLDTPLARAVVAAYGGALNEEHIKNVQREAGAGVLLDLDGIQLHFGTDTYCTQKGLSLPQNDGSGSRLHMAANGIYAGSLSLGEAGKQGLSSRDIMRFTEEGVEALVMVSGDAREKDSALAASLGIEEYYSECSFEEKRRVLCSLKERMGGRGKLALVAGAGLTEELFSEADLNVLVTNSCGDKKAELADALILKGSAGGLNSLIRTGKRVSLVSLVGLGLVALVKLMVIVLSVFGYAPLWFGVLLDVCASLGALLGCTVYFLRYYQADKE